MGGSIFRFTVYLFVYVFQNIFFAIVSVDTIEFLKKRSFTIAAEGFCFSKILALALWFQKHLSNI